MIKVAFLDRNGTINKDYDDNVWKNINNQEILDGNIEGLKKIKYYGYKIIIITNQYIIALITTLINATVKNLKRV